MSLTLDQNAWKVLHPSFAQKELIFSHNKCTCMECLHNNCVDGLYVNCLHFENTLPDWPLSESLTPEKKVRLMDTVLKVDFRSPEPAQLTRGSHEDIWELLGTAETFREDHGSAEDWVSDTNSAWIFTAIWVSVMFCCNFAGLVHQTEYCLCEKHIKMTSNRATHVFFMHKCFSLGLFWLWLAPHLVTTEGNIF